MGLVSNIASAWSRMTGPGGGAAEVAGGIMRRSPAAEIAVPPQALAEEVPSLANGWWYAGSGIDLDNGTRATYAAMYESQSNLAALIDKLAAATARLSLQVWDVSDPDRPVLDLSSPLAHMVADPCTTMAPFAFWRWLASTYEIYGEVFCRKDRESSGRLVKLTPILPSRLAVRRTPETGEVRYLYTLGIGAPGIVGLPESDVFRMLRYNPSNIMRGFSRMEPLRAALQNDDSARRAIGSFWKRGARPSMVVRHPGQLSQGAADRIQRSITAKHSGAGNAGSVLVLDEAMDAKIMQLNLEEMQYIESRRLNREECCMMYDVPPPVVHILDRATFSNITEQMRSMYRDTMAPRLMDIESALNTWVVPEFTQARPGEPGARVVKFALDEVLTGDYENLVKAQVSLITSGGATPNEARRKLGLPAYDDPVADLLFGNQALQPLGTPTTAAAPAPDAPAAPDEAAVVGPEAQPAPELPPSAPAPTKTLSRKAAGIAGAIKSAGTRDRMRLQAERMQERAFRPALQAQADAVKAALASYGAVKSAFDAAAVAGDLYAPEDWNRDLADAITDVTDGTIAAYAQLYVGKGYDPGRTEAWREVSVERTAAAINDATLAGLEQAVRDGSDAFDAAADGGGRDRRSYIEDAVAAYFGYVLGARLAEIVGVQVTRLSGFGSMEGAKQSGRPTKTWVVDHPRPRDSHRRIDGETVGIDDAFSLGGKYPGDHRMPADETSGCTCFLDFN